MPLPPKPFKTYLEQVQILRSRGMDVGDLSSAEAALERVNYYRLSGYWHTFRAGIGRGLAPQLVPVRDDPA